MNVSYVDHLGSDLTVVNAARVSFDKTSEWEADGSTINKLKERDKKLIKFLAKNGHWTPFGHCFVQLRIKAPIFVARQLAKHQIGLTWNEISRRYVDSDPEFYFPEKWRKKNPDKKQGSYENEFVDVNVDGIFGVKSVANTCLELYKNILAKGGCAEQARMVLPQNMYTEWYWSGSLYAFARICNLRLKADTQKETRDIATQISEIILPLFPESWKNLVEPEPKMEYIDIDLSTYERDLLEYLVKQSCEQDITVNKVLENIIKTYLTSNEISKL